MLVEFEGYSSWSCRQEIGEEEKSEQGWRSKQDLKDAWEKNVDGIFPQKKPPLRNKSQAYQQFFDFFYIF